MDEPLTPDDDAPAPTLADRLLHAELPVERKRWAYPWWGMLLVSVFVVYHATILLVWNTPSTHLAEGLHKVFNKTFVMRDYMYATGNHQSWAMFAPNPHRSNMFMKVLVTDKEGQVWDLAHDIYGHRKYPYILYDRMGKINRRIIEQKGYRRHYAAWVCREWERTHGGEAAREVKYVKMWTRIPPPRAVIEAAGWNLGAMWYDPMQLHLHQSEEDTIPCRTTRQAQLPIELRERYGLPTEGVRYLGLTIQTWWDTRERAAKREQREAVSAAPGGEVDQ